MMPLSLSVAKMDSIMAVMCPNFTLCTPKQLLRKFATGRNNRSAELLSKGMSGSVRNSVSPSQWFFKLVKTLHRLSLYHQFVDVKFERGKDG